jgi:hypothetical protein
MNSKTTTTSASNDIFPHPYISFLVHSSNVLQYQIKLSLDICYSTKIVGYFTPLKYQTFATMLEVARLCFSNIWHLKPNFRGISFTSVRLTKISNCLIQ